jgi:hypothetical protein
MELLRRLSRADIAKVESVKATLEKAAKLVQIPWQMIASVWYRESFSVVSPVTPGGPFQFDPEPNPRVRKALLEDYTELDAIDVEKYVLVGVDKFEAGAIYCGCWLRHQCKYDLILDKDNPVAIKDAFYGYNGKAFGPNPESSPYVYNEFDKMHMGMTFKGSIPDRYAANGRRWITITDQRPGAFTVYTQLLQEKV